VKGNGTAAFTAGTVALGSEVSGTLPIANGGTNATTASAALTSLGAYAATNPDGYTTNTGTVTSVGSTGTVNGITLTGTVTSSGSLTLGGTLSGVNLTSQVTGTLPVANGGTGVTASTGTGSVVLSASPTFTGTVTTATADLLGSVRGNIVAVAALDIDCSAGNYFTKTINANSTFTFSNAPSSRAYAFTLELTHTSGTITWPASVQWPNGTAPTLTTGKTHLLTFVTDDAGTRWRGVAQPNYTN
jgi:cytoskeletal protein CcmA (bactofilin family)